MHVHEKVKVVYAHEMADGHHHEKVEEHHMLVGAEVEKSLETKAVNVLYAAEDYRQMAVGGHGVVEHASEVV